MAHIAVRTELMDRMSVRAGIRRTRIDARGVGSWYEARLRCLSCIFGEQCPQAAASARTSAEAGVRSSVQTATSSLSANSREDAMNIERLGVFERLRQSWHRSASRRRVINELDACPPNELRHIAADAGPSGNDLRQFCRSDHGASQLLPRRLRLLGLDAEYVRHAEPTLFRDLARVWASCPASRRCARDLTHGDVQTGMSSYCLNGLSIDLPTVGCNRPGNVVGHRG